MVDFVSKLNSLRVNLLSKLLLPTPESPIRTTEKRQLYCEHKSHLPKETHISTTEKGMVAPTFVQIVVLLLCRGVLAHVYVAEVLCGEEGVGAGASKKRDKAHKRKAGNVTQLLGNSSSLNAVVYRISCSLPCLHTTSPCSQIHEKNSGISPSFFDAGMKMIGNSLPRGILRSMQCKD